MARREPAPFVGNDGGVATCRLAAGRLRCGLTGGTVATGRGFVATVAGVEVGWPALTVCALAGIRIGWPHCLFGQLPDRPAKRGWTLNVMPQARQRTRIVGATGEVMASQFGAGGASGVGAGG
jgi:hypothetical protein